MARGKPKAENRNNIAALQWQPTTTCSNFGAFVVPVREELLLIMAVHAIAANKLKFPMIQKVILTFSRVVQSTRD
jgi:hypothetical protein